MSGVLVYFTVLLLVLLVNFMKQPERQLSATKGQWCSLPAVVPVVSDMSLIAAEDTLKIWIGLQPYKMLTANNNRI